jgi:hypothetical protein
LDEQLEKLRVAEPVEHLLPEDIVPFAGITGRKTGVAFLP